jgi:hypothetical protein
MAAQPGTAGSGFRSGWMNVLASLGLGSPTTSAPGRQQAMMPGLASTNSSSTPAENPARPRLERSESCGQHAVVQVRSNSIPRGIGQPGGKLHSKRASIDTTKKEYTAGSAAAGMISPGKEFAAGRLGPSNDATAAPGVWVVPLPAALHRPEGSMHASHPGLARADRVPREEAFIAKNGVPGSPSPIDPLSAEAERPGGEDAAVESSLERTIGSTARVDMEGKTPAMKPEVQAHPDESQTYLEPTSTGVASAGDSGGPAVANSEAAGNTSLRAVAGSAGPARVSESRPARGTVAERNAEGDGTIRFAPPEAGATQPLRELGGVLDHAQQQGSGTGISPRIVVDPDATFAALDAGRPSPPATWIHAGTRHAEAGFLDPALGWVGVRADAVGDRVHAAVVPDSAEAAQVLGTHLAGLNAFLSEQHGATITMGSFDGGQSGQGGQGSSGNLRDQSGAETNGRETPRQGPESAPVIAAAHTPSIPAIPNAASATAGTAMYISVVA